VDDPQLMEAPAELNAVEPSSPGPRGQEAVNGHAATGPILIDQPWPIWRMVLSLVWPVLLQQVVVLSVSFSDRLLAGRFQALNQEEQIATQAALTTAAYIDWLISSFTVLVGVGSTALVARFTGARDRSAAIAVTHQSILLAAFLGVAGAGLALLNLPAFVAALGLDGPAGVFAVRFLWPLFLLLPMRIIESAGIACLVGAGDTRTGLWVLTCVAGLNVPLAWLCFHGVGPLPRMGFPGIGLGTAVSHAVGGLLVLGVLSGGRARLYLDFRRLTPDVGLLRRLLRISVPAAADSLTVAFAQLWFIRIVNRLGIAASGAHGIALYWEALGYLSGASFGTAAMTLVGQNLGANRPDQAARSGWTAFALGGTIMSFMGVIFFVLAEPMFWLFCPDTGQAAIVQAGVPVLRLIAFAMPFLASCIIFTSALRGAGDTRVPVVFTLIGFFVLRIPLAYLLTEGPLYLGLWGAWLAMSADIVVRGLFFVWRFQSGHWQRIRV
jgi:putative MATE family efflux protein